MVYTESMSHFCCLFSIKIFSIEYHHIFWYANHFERIFTHVCNRKKKKFKPQYNSLLSFSIEHICLILHKLSLVFCLMVIFLTDISIVVLLAPVKTGSELGKISPKTPLAKMAKSSILLDCTVCE